MEQQFIESNTPIRSRRAIIAIACGLVALTLAIATAFAYLMDTDSIQSHLKVNTDLSIELQEPNFDQESIGALAPAETFAKDPLVKNTGNVGVFIQMKVKVPTFNGSIHDEEGRIVNVSDHALFRYQINDGWKLVGEGQIAGGYITYTYIYEKPLSPGESSNTLFDAATVANLAESLDSSDFDLDVEANAIQSSGFDSAEDAFGAYSQLKASAPVVAL